MYDLIGGECAFSTLSLLAGGGLFALADTAVSVQSVDLNFVIMSSGGGPLAIFSVQCQENHLVLRS